MLLVRRFANRLARGTVALVRSAINPTLSFQESQETKLIVPRRSPLAYVSLATLGSYTMPLPKGYTNAAKLLVYIRTEGLIKVVVTSPNHAASSLLLKGLTTQRGQFSIVDNVTAIVVSNPTVATVQFGYTLIELPDLTSATSFYNLVG